MFNEDELNQIKLQFDAAQAQSRPQQPQKKKVGGLRGLIGGALPLVGGAIGATLGSFVAPVAGTAAGGAVGSGAGAFLKQRLLGEDTNIGEIGKEAALGVVPGVLKGASAGVRSLRGLKGARETQVLEQANQAARAPDAMTTLGRDAIDAGVPRLPAPSAQTTEQAMLQMRPSITQRAGRRLTESGSGLKAGNNVGDAARLDEQAQFMTKYAGTPRQQRVAMERDMSDLSTQVDDILTRTPVRVDGGRVGQRLQQASTDLTDERFVDLDLTNPSVQKIIERYSSKFSQAQDGKGVNDVIKTLNKTATRAADKLSNPTASALTAQETAALALKRAGDDVLSEIAEIAPLKKNMAQIFEATPQVARAGEKGIGLPFVSGVSVKAPVQALKGIQSKAGAMLQGTPPPGAPPVNGGVPTGFRPYVRPAIEQGVSRAVVSPFLSQPEEEQAPQVDQQLPPVLPEATEQIPPAAESAFSNEENVQKAYLQALAAGDKETAQLILGGYEKFGRGAQKDIKKTETQRARDEAAALTDTAIQMLGQGSISTGLLGANVEKVKGMFSAGDPETIDFNNIVSNLRATIAKARGGSSFTATEKAMLNQYTPKVGDSGQELRSKLAALKEVYVAAQAREYGTQYTDGNMVQAAL